MTSTEAMFRDMFHRNYRLVIGYALRRSASTQDAEDVLAETFLTAWRRFDELPRTPQHQTLWLYGAARRLLGNQRRGVARGARLHQRLARDRTASSEAALRSTESSDVDDALAALGELSDIDQEVLTLALWEELSYAEIAKVTDTTVANVAVRFHRAKKRLRGSFERIRCGRVGSSEITSIDPSFRQEETR